MAEASSATCAREAKLRLNRITPATASCCSQSRSCAVSSVPATPITSMRGNSRARGEARRALSQIGGEGRDEAGAGGSGVGAGALGLAPLRIRAVGQGQVVVAAQLGDLGAQPVRTGEGLDRKSTRLNSSHVRI